MRSIIVFFLLLCFVGATAQSADDFYKLAEKYQSEKKCVSAITEIDKAIWLDSTKWEYYNIKADCLSKLGQHQEAFLVYTRGINVNPKEMYLYSNRGNLLLSLGKFDHAIQDFTTALQLSKDDTTKLTSYTNRAAAKISKRDFNGAYDDLMSAYKIDSTEIATLTNLGAVCDEVGRGDETLKYLLKAVEVDPNFLGAYGNIGFKYQEMGQYKKAIEYFNKVLEFDPNEPLGYSNRAYNRLKLEDTKGAMEDINKSIKIYPANSYAYKVRALVYIEMKDYNKACVDLQIALDKGFTVSYGDDVVNLRKKYCDKVN
jgi:tetratricopeptide (TPR) repeat protein